MTKQELENKLADLRTALTIAKGKNLKADIEKEIADTELELSNLANAPMTQSNPDFLATILSTIATQMGSGKGSGVDSPQVRAIIRDYLHKDKVHLNELDQEILAEIKKNQMITLELPGYAKKFEVGKEATDIPNFWEIVDDVLAGNNVYLIGEAGGGKTYTAEQISAIIGRKAVTLNCSQYTSPLEILGGQSIDGFKEGKLIDCWKNGKILIMDEMPKLDPNTAGLFNDALAKSSKTKTDESQRINSANTEEPPIPRNKDFGIIATGNIYPNTAPPEQYRGNNQQDLSLLDRFSGSVYYTDFNETLDQKMCRFEFLYRFLVGNYHEYIKKKMNNQTLPTPIGLRTIIEDNNMKNLALVSYRTEVSFRVGFEYELVRAIARKEGKDVQVIGKTLAKTFDSYMVAFRSNRDTYNTLISLTGYTQSYIENLVEDAIEEITRDEAGFSASLTEKARETANPIFKTYKDFLVSEQVKVNP
jgi:midasin (ATPase involved in ribosome maturation)